MITQEYLISAFEYKDGQLIRKIGRANEIGQIAGYLIPAGYVRLKIKGKNYAAHRIIFFYHNGYLPECVDHINGIKTDNCIENLRAATKSENCMNQKLRNTNKSGIKGLKWQKSNSRWVVAIMKNYKYYYFGCFKDKELAELVAIEATELVHGKFSSYKGVLNGKLRNEK